ncbi:MAG: cell division protein FtsZ [Rhodospirillales bacterium]|nr:cell division protein FtsZ [Alphaproteobacteria bacterium]USO04546.1 MAG: cell division protein FtsZ [Rhodospirillales bacterium]
MINVRIQTPEVQKLSPRITVVGVGGAGGNAVNNMISSGLEGCEFLVCNTDAQALEGSLCEDRLQLGVHVTGGLGSGAKPSVGKQAAEESLDELMQYLEGSNMAFITAGMGGGTGTGAAPVIAKACRDSGILTVGVVTKPFHFEGSHRMSMAESGIQEMQEFVDTLIVIPNQNLFRVANEKTTFPEAFRMADSVLQSGVRGVTDLMVVPGLINLDFADIRSAMLEMGKAMMGSGEAEGERRAIEAAEAAISNPLLDDVSMKGARGVIINVTGGPDMTLFEVDEACNRIREEVDPNANIIFGSTFEDKLEGKMRVSVVATGIDVVESKKTGSLGGGVKVTSVGHVQSADTRPSLERARPNTETTIQSATAAARAAAMPPVSAMAPSVSAEADMFEQREFIATAPAQYRMPQMHAEGDVLRGSVQAGRFIPPAPAIAEPRNEAPVGYGGQFVPPAPVRAPADSSLVLRPPVPGAHSAEHRKKTPSLFERITGVRGHYAKGDEGDATETEAFHSGLRAERPQNSPSQGQLGIDSPAAPKSETKENDLDIPAFLRRQAN